MDDPHPVRLNARAALILAGIGAALGPMLDYAHAANGAIRYGEPVRFVPWWVPLLYAGAALSIGLSHPLADILLRRAARVSLTPPRVAMGFLGFLAVWFASGAIHLGSLIVTMILAPASLAMWWMLDRTAIGLVLAAGTAAFGAMVEISLMRAGLFHHTSPDMLGLAYWLPWIYVAGSVGIGNLGRWLCKADTP